MKLRDLIIILVPLSFLTACNDSDGGFCPSDTPGLDGCDLAIDPFKNEISLLLDDSFERDTLVPSDVPEFSFWWRKVINDQGVIFDGIPGKNVDLALFSSDQMGIFADGNKALYFYGREGKSIHNIYLISKSYDLSKFHQVVIDFSFLPIDLEPEDYLKVEVCNDTDKRCGIDGPIELAGLNSTAWHTVFQVSGEGNGLNGKNQNNSDWRNARIVLLLGDFLTEKFTFRVNVRVDEGFIKNQIVGPMEDGVAIDAIRVRATKKDIPPEYL